MCRSALYWLMLLFCVEGYAQDARIKMVAFRENAVVPIYGKTFTTTQIVFGEDEIVKGVEGGDTTAWIVDFKPAMPNMIFIKPTVLGSKSNMTVVTNKHHYYFKVRSNKSVDLKDEVVTYALKFTYPTERLKEEVITAKEPKTYNWNYSFHGSNQLKPLHAFDDGTFTYFELQKNQAVPAIFAVEDKEGKETVVNTRVEGKYLIVQGLFPQFTLRHGRTIASIFNDEAIAAIQKHRG